MAGIIYDAVTCCFHNPVQFVSFLRPAVSKPASDAGHDYALGGASVIDCQGWSGEVPLQVQCLHVTEEMATMFYLLNEGCGVVTGVQTFLQIHFLILGALCLLYYRSTDGQWWDTTGGCPPDIHDHVLSFVCVQSAECYLVEWGH